MHLILVDVSIVLLSAGINCIGLFIEKNQLWAELKDAVPPPSIQILIIFWTCRTTKQDGGAGSE
jgi:hypothetical protein